MPYDFGLVNLAQKCGITVLKKLPDGEYQARCPFCGDTQKHKNKGHLYLNSTQGKWYCNCCGEGGLHPFPLRQAPGGGQQDSLPGAVEWSPGAGCGGNKAVL